MLDPTNSSSTNKETPVLGNGDISPSANNDAYLQTKAGAAQ